MNPQTQQKLRKFLNEKLRKIYNETRDDKPKLDLSYIKTQKGYENSVIIDAFWGDGYEFPNSNGYQCYFYFKGGIMAKVFKVTPKRVKRTNGTVLTPDMSITFQKIIQIKNGITLHK